VNGDRVIVQKYAYWLSKPKRGDIVAFNRKTFSPGLPDNVVWCKRIVGTPGEYFVMGDNRDNSQDSRSDGTIPATTIIGKATKIYWPLRRAGAVR
jgi:signal peptidase I